MSTVVDFPVFDADNHMYETTDAFTKFLPKQYDGLVKYVQVNGRTKIALRNVISDYIPNPTFEVVGRPGAQEAYFKEGNPEGKSRRDISSARWSTRRTSSALTLALRKISPPMLPFWCSSDSNRCSGLMAGEFISSASE